jgi:ABC-type phosphate transport system substrate-binding protein
MVSILPLPLRPGLAVIGFALVLCAGSVMAEIVAVVSTKNPLSALSKSQVADIFLGKASRFPDGSPAVPLDQVEGTSARDDFYLDFAGKSPAQLKAHWSKIIFTGRGQPPKEVLNGVEAKKRIAGNPNAIAYIEQNQVDDTVKVLIAQ